MTNYSNGKIYKVVGGCECYLGSTTKKYLSERMVDHRYRYKKWKEEKKHYISVFKLFENYGVENCTIVLIEIFPCTSKDELLARERYWFDKIDCVNLVKPKQTKQELRQQQKRPLLEKDVFPCRKLVSTL